MKIAVCSSMATQELVDNIYVVGQELEKLGCEPVLPPKMLSYDHQVSDVELAKIKSAYFINHLDKIKDSDAILVLNPRRKSIDGYIGGNTLCEMAVAFGHRKKIFVLYPLPEPGQLSYTAEIFAMQPIVLNGDLSQLKVAA